MGESDVQASTSVLYLTVVVPVHVVALVYLHVATMSGRSHSLAVSVARARWAASVVLLVMAVPVRTAVVNALVLSVERTVKVLRALLVP